LKAGARIAQQLINWARMQPLRERGAGYEVAPLGAHGFGIVAHYTTLARQLDELAAAGFVRDAEVYASATGNRVRVGDDTHDVGYFHLIATPTRS
jgi:hypothetical protein